MGFVFGHVWIQVEYIEYLICIHGAKSLLFGVISQ